MTLEVSWFAALCDDDYEFLGVPDPALASSWEHCRGIALAAEEAGYDNILLPSGYALGIDSVAFAAGIAPLLRRMRLLLAVRLGEMWVPQLARQLASYLRRREVVCTGVSDSATARCRIEGDDLAALILAAGGARASEDAPADLLGAEEQARAERVGLWGR